MDFTAHTAYAMICCRGLCEEDLIGLVGLEQTLSLRIALDLNAVEVSRADPQRCKAGCDGDEHSRTTDRKRCRVG